MCCVLVGEGGRGRKDSSIICSVLPGTKYSNVWLSLAYLIHIPDPA